MGLFVVTVQSLAKYDRYSLSEKASVGEQYNYFLCRPLEKPMGISQKSMNLRACLLESSVASYQEGKYIKFVGFSSKIVFSFPEYQ